MNVAVGRVHVSVRMVSARRQPLPIRETHAVDGADVEKAYRYERQYRAVEADRERWAVSSRHPLGGAGDR